MIANPCCAQYRTLALRRRNGDASFSLFLSQILAAVT